MQVQIEGFAIQPFGKFALQQTFRTLYFSSSLSAFLRKNFICFLYMDFFLQNNFTLKMGCRIRIDDGGIYVMMGYAIDMGQKRGLNLFLAHLKNIIEKKTWVKPQALS